MYRVINNYAELSKANSKLQHMDTKRLINQHKTKKLITHKSLCVI